MNQLTVSCHSKCPVQAKALCDPWVGFISCVTGWPPGGGTGLCCGWLCTCGQFCAWVLSTASCPALGAAAPLLCVWVWTVQNAEKQINTKSTLTGICFCFFVVFWKWIHFFFFLQGQSNLALRTPLYYGHLSITDSCQCPNKILINFL